MKQCKFIVMVLLSVFSLFASPEKKEVSKLGAWYIVQQAGKGEKGMQVKGDGTIYLSTPHPDGGSVLIPVQLLDEPLFFTDTKTNRVFHLKRADECFSLKFAACCTKEKCCKCEHKN